MKYKMKVTITKPNTENEMVRELNFELTCIFSYYPEQYGNGHYLSIYGKNFNEVIIDLRYYKNFKRNKKEEWLAKWAKDYWSGKKGAWAIKKLKITHE